MNNTTKNRPALIVVLWVCDSPRWSQGQGWLYKPLKTENTKSKSFWRWAGLIVFTGHSSILYTTMFNLWSVGRFTLEAKGLMLVMGCLEFTDLSAEPLTFLMKAIVSARFYSSFALWVYIARSSTFKMFSDSHTHAHTHTHMHTLGLKQISILSRYPDN